MQAQRVTVSKEFNVRGDLAYDIIGQVEDRLIMFRDLGNTFQAEVFDEDLSHIVTREIMLRNKRLDILATTKNDTSWSILYEYWNKDICYVHAHRLNKSANLIDSFPVLWWNKSTELRNPKVVYSNKKSKMLVFATDGKEKLMMAVINNEIDSLPILWSKTVTFADYRINTDFRKIFVTELGEVTVLLEKDGDHDKHHLAIVMLKDEEREMSKILLKDLYTHEIHFKFDDYNRRLLILGLYANEDEYQSDGYYFVNKPWNLFESEEFPTKVPFGLQFISDVYGKEIGKENTLRDYKVHDIRFRRDGGFLFLAEMNREYSRRSAFGGGGFPSGVDGGRGWVDYYYEDIISIAVHPDGREHWRTILYKKQFSQDDDGIFSSFKIFETPSRLRILFNDEIRNNNTVSEYVLGPLGKYNRNSVLSTEYQNLKLRFRDAVQLTNTVLIVPSERNYNLSLVKIDFEI